MADDNYVKLVSPPLSQTHVQVTDGQVTDTYKNTSFDESPPPNHDPSSTNGIKDRESSANKNGNDDVPSRVHKLLMMLKLITVEPLVFLAMVNFFMCSVIFQSMVMRKFCLSNFNLTNEECTNLNETSEEEKQIQSWTTNLQLYKTLIETGPMVTFILFAGAWSDRFGRKLPLFLPVIGGSVTMIVLCVNAYFMTEIDVYWLLTSQLGIACTGGLFGTMTISAAYISDASTPETRVLRLGLVQMSFMAGGPIGSILGGQTFRLGSYIGVFGLALVLYFISGVYVMVIIPETIKRDETKPKSKAENTSMFNWKNVRDGLRVVFMKRENNRRVHLILMILCTSISIFPLIGDHNIMYPYVKLRYRWDEVMYSYYTTTALVASISGLLIILPVLALKFKVKDSATGCISAAARVCTEVTVAASSEGWMLFTSVPFMILSGLSSPIIRNTLSKCVSKEEQGKMYSVMGAFESSLPIVASVIYTQVYNATKDTKYPGAVYIISAILCAFPAFLFLWVYKDVKRQDRKLNDKMVSESTGGISVISSL